jgi:hypothetical protein
MKKNKYDEDAHAFQHPTMATQELKSIRLNFSTNSPKFEIASWLSEVICEPFMLFPSVGEPNQHAMHDHPASSNTMHKNQLHLKSSLSQVGQETASALVNEMHKPYKLQCVLRGVLDYQTEQTAIDHQ